MTSVIYASSCALTIVWLSLNVIKIRHHNRVNIGDVGNEQFKASMAVWAIRYSPG